MVLTDSTAIQVLEASKANQALPELMVLMAPLVTREHVAQQVLMDLQVNLAARANQVNAADQAVQVRKVTWALLELTVLLALMGLQVQLVPRANQVMMLWTEVKDK